jgi:choline dehydrogenase-like flavoprotein
MRTFLQDAFQGGARIGVNTHVERVLIEDGRAVGVAARARTADGRAARLTIRARAVVLAAGSLHTPALMLRSGLTNAHIGRNLHLHPSTGTFGLYEKPICGWSGVMMSHYIAALNDLDGRGYGVTIESAPGHPGLAALSFPWRSGRDHKDLMAAYAHSSNVLVIARDRDGGRVTVDQAGEPVVHYRLSAYDRAHLLRGVAESLRIHHAAGAHTVSNSSIRPGAWRAGDDFEGYVGTVVALGLRPNAFILGSAHQMSSCRMGGSAAQGAIDPTGESYEVRGLYVADGSALPTATGVNPMLTIMGVAHIIAGHIAAKLT